jgi:hypothetical protein
VIPRKTKKLAHALIFTSKKPPNMQHIEVENIQQLQPKLLKKQTKNQKQPKPQPNIKKFCANTHNNN